ncbi:hypothetical protein ASF21_11675 [Arthrobacter sp. Leaf234]|uniref:GAF domain-containing protein n=1 Tax=Arthrobacter sp. Leaf234 TaxID=1736303 RepID=UPI0006F33376|nr:GAF domain-containing protein [Arthrobacter sp. Leaf234]KQO00942.1 hypothetical protein ASF21_11675 [Arthrobacter sp. Leaf234]
MSSQVQITTTTRALSEANLELSQLWMRYYAIGGAVSGYEVEAYLGGLLILPGPERDLLADAMNELLEQTSVLTRVPQSGAQSDGGSEQDPRKALGAAAAFLFTDGEAEQERLDAVTRTHLLDTASEQRFDRYTARVRTHLGVRSSIIALIDDHRMFLKSVLGPIEQNLPREITFCNATIRNAGPLIIPDSLKDARFASNPLVLGEPRIRFYAGYPLRGQGGWTVGTLCAIDQAPRDFSAADERFLQDVALAVEAEITR